MILPRFYFFSLTFFFFFPGIKITKAFYKKKKKKKSKKGRGAKSCRIFNYYHRQISGSSESAIPLSYKNRQIVVFSKRSGRRKNIFPRFFLFFRSRHLGAEEKQRKTMISARSAISDKRIFTGTNGRKKIIFN